MAFPKAKEPKMKKASMKAEPPMEQAPVKAFGGKAAKPTKFKMPSSAKKLSGFGAPTGGPPKF